jgi:L-fuculose-phosphate aldolase
MDANERKLIVEYGRRLYEKGLVAGTDGNLSVRLDRDRLLITPSGAAKGSLRDDDLVLVDINGKKLSGKGVPSSEILMHLHVYHLRPDIKACCHAHPSYATAFSIIGTELPPNVLPESIIMVGKIALTEYAPPGTQAVPTVLDRFVKNHDAFLLRNHGVLTIGRTMEEAYRRMEIVEHLAKIVYIAKNSGKLNLLDPAEVSRLEKIREAYLQGREE